ncbi:hypothetical protein [Sphingomonas edaphi]|uniref:hypothetical protein n=1 Tax=Sphingomonas edaphi TaxID=2315689 RepID=UPI0011C3EF57|nr:hypothetical protein [Sphingomonas edaphi]
MIDGARDAWTNRDGRSTVDEAAAHVREVISSDKNIRLTQVRRRQTASAGQVHDHPVVSGSGAGT